jgi:hypothetical protein
MGEVNMTDNDTDHPDGVDALVTALPLDVGLGPDVQTRDVILVTGPWLAGSTGLIQALGQRLPNRTFVDSAELAEGDAPAAVVYVTSAVGPLTESDCVLLDSAAAYTDLVIGAVSKIDVHRAWRDVLAANQAVVAAHDARYADMVWVGVAAAPEVGQPRVDDLVDALEEGLAQNQLPRRNRLRAWQTRLTQAMSRNEDAVSGVGREARVAALRQERSEVLQQRRLARSERTAALHSRVERVQVQMTDFARKRCASVRSELAEDAAGMTRRRLPEFERYVGNRVGDVIREVHAGLDMELSDLANESGSTPPAGERPPAQPAVPPPPMAKSRLGAWLTMLLGVVFGLGAALALSRLFADLTPAYIAAGLAVGAAVGLVVAVSAVGMRRLLRDRAALRRWINDVMSGLQAVLEQHVGERVGRAESVLTAEQAQRDEAEAGDVADRVAAIDSELREHAVAAVRATARRDREVPALQRALDAVHAELDGSAARIGENEN